MDPVNFKRKYMTIEIYTPHNEVPEHIIFYLRGKLMDFYHRDHRIDKTEVVLRHQDIGEGIGYVCEVTINLCGETIMVHRSNDSYLQSIREVIKEIRRILDDFFEHRNELPEEIPTTVRV